MSNHPHSPCVRPFFSTLFSSSAPWFFSGLLLGLLLLPTPVRSQETGPNEQYLKIYSLVDQADALTEKGQTDAAKAKYQEAHAALLNFKKANPEWNAKVVAFRLKNLADKIAPPVPAAVASAPPAVVKPEDKPAAKPSKSSASALPVIKLLEAGAEPRRELRLHPQTGDKHAFTMTLQASMDMGTGQLMKIPAIQIISEITIQSVSPAGQIVTESLLREAEVADDPAAAPAMLASMKTSLHGMKGLVIISTISSRGLPLASEIKLPPGASPQTRQSVEKIKEAMGQMFTFLPEEAVGAGAKWEAKQTFKSQGMVIGQTITSELISLEGDRLTLKNTFAQDAAHQKIANPAMPQMKGDLVKMTGTGTGDTTLDLSHAVPVLVTMDSASETDINMNVGGKNQPLNMKATMAVRLESK